MKTLIVTHFYPPEQGAAATRVASLAAALARAGHDVTVLTNFPSFPRGRYFQRPRGAAETRWESGVRVVRLRALLLAGVPGSRLLHWLSSAAAACAYVLATRRRCDVVVASSPPLTVALPAWLAARRFRARLVLDVRDVFPDIAIAMGAWKQEAPIARATERFVRRLYARADLIAAVTPTALAQIAARGVPPQRLLLVRNAAQRDAFDQTSPALPQRRRGALHAVYAGNLGVATDVDVLLRAAAQLRGVPVTIEIVGGGAQRPALERRLAEEALNNVILRDSVPREAAMALLARSDVAIVPLQAGIQESVPTKLYDAMSVGCPAIVVADGEARREGEALGAFCVPAADADGLAALLRQLTALDREALRAAGDAGKARIDSRDDRAGIMADFVERIATLTGAANAALRNSATIEKTSQAYL